MTLLFVLGMQKTQKQEKMALTMNKGTYSIERKKKEKMEET